MPINLGRPAPEPIKTAEYPSSLSSSSIVTDLPTMTFVSIFTPRTVRFRFLSLQHSLWEDGIPEYRIPVHRLPSQRLENGHIIAHLRQIACTGQTCRAGTDDCYLFSPSFSAAPTGRMLFSLMPSPLHETLQFADRHCFALNTTDTFSFTLAFPAGRHDRRQREVRWIR